MVENPTPGLSMWPGEAPVTVTREEHHQDALARYSVAPGRERRVAVELSWCRIASGKYKGERGIEVRLDGARVGELTYLMSQRYAPIVEHAGATGTRAGCEAVVERTERGLQVTLLLPSNENVLSTVEAPTQRMLPVPAPRAAGRQPVFVSRKPLWIGGAVVLIVFFFAVVVQGGDDPSPGAASGDDTTTTTTTTDTTTTFFSPPPTTTTTTTTTTPPPPPPPPPVTVTPPPVAPVTEEPPPPPPAPSGCDPNYTGCVPVASDVDCAGGSGNGPAYLEGSVQVIGDDVYGLDSDDDGTACE